MLRSAFGTVFAAARCARRPSFQKSSFSTVSFHPSLFDDGCDDCGIGAGQKGAPVALNPASTTSYDCLTSCLRDTMTAALSRNSAVATVDATAKRLEEKGDWEDISRDHLLKMTMEGSPSGEFGLDLSIWQISTLKRRKKMMNKHKLRKRKKKMRLKTRRQ